MFLNREVMVTSFGCRLYCGGAPPRLLELGAGDDGCGRVQCDRAVSSLKMYVRIACKI